MFFDFFLSFLYISCSVFCLTKRRRTLSNLQIRTFYLKKRPLFAIFFKFNTVQKILFSYIRLHFCNKQNWFSYF